MLTAQFGAKASNIFYSKDERGMSQPISERTAPSETQTAALDDAQAMHYCILDAKYPGPYRTNRNASVVLWSQYCASVAGIIRGCLVRGRSRGSS